MYNHILMEPTSVKHSDNFHIKYLSWVKNITKSSMVKGYIIALKHNHHAIRISNYYITFFKLKTLLKIIYCTSYHYFFHHILSYFRTTSYH